jgi:hypothetical protein
MILVLRREVDKNCVLLGYYAITQRVVAIYYGRFGQIYRAGFLTL